jgi:hypothetical protein
MTASKTFWGFKILRMNHRQHVCCCELLPHPIPRPARWLVRQMTMASGAPRPARAAAIEYWLLWDTLPNSLLRMRYWIFGWRRPAAETGSPLE